MSVITARIDDDNEIASKSGLTNANR